MGEALKFLVPASNSEQAAVQCQHTNFTFKETGRREITHTLTRIQTSSCPGS